MNVYRNEYNILNTIVKLNGKLKFNGHTVANLIVKPENAD